VINVEAVMNQYSVFPEVVLFWSTNVKHHHLSPKSENRNPFDENKGVSIVIAALPQ